MKRLLFPANLEHLNIILDAIREETFTLFPLTKFPKQLELAIEEALVNIFSYAYPDKKGEVQLQLKKEKEMVFCLTISDWGISYNPIDYLSHDKCLMDHDRVGGVGVYLISKIIHDLQYERVDSKNILTFRYDFSI